MALRTVTVKAAAGDYSSLNSSYVGEGGNLVTLDRQLEIDCYNFVDTTAAIAGAGWTTDATHTVLVAAVDNHAGFFGGSGGIGAYSLVGSATGIDAGSASYFTFRGISASISAPGVAITEGPNSISNQVIVSMGSGASGGSAGISQNVGCVAVNCLVIGSIGQNQIGFYGSNATGTSVCYNCTSYGASTGFANFNGGTIAAVNCLAARTSTASGTAFDQGTTTWTGSSNCASTDATVPTSGAGHRANQAILLNGPSTGDYSLDASDVGAKGYGTDLSADPTFPFSIDITGADRTVPWDIGAFLPTGTSSYGYLLEFVRLQLEDGSGIYLVEDGSGAVLAEISAISDTADRLILEDSSGIISLETQPVVVTPGVGALIATGFAPAVVINNIVRTDIGALTVAGLAPTVVLGNVVYPGTGVTTVTGLAPTVVASDNKTVATGLGALTVAGLAPTIAVSNNQTVSTGLGALVATGFAVTIAVSDNKSVATGLGVLTLTGLAPTVVVSDNKTAATDLGTLIVAGLAPTVSVSDNQTISTGIGALTVTGFAPTAVLTDNQIVATNVGALTVTGLAPLVVLTIRVFPDVGVLTLTGFNPTVVSTANQIANTDVGSLTVAGLAPTVVSSDNQTVSTGLGILTITGQAPAVIASGNQTAFPGVGVLTVTGFAPGIMFYPEDPTLTFSGQFVPTTDYYY